MSLRFVSARDITEYGQNVADNSQDPPVAGGSSTGKGQIIGSPSDSAIGFLKPHVGRDRFYCFFRLSSLSQSTVGVGYVDPFFVANSPPNADMINATSIALTPGRMNMDQYDPSTGTQRIFVADVSQFPYELDPVTLIATGGIFTGPNGNFRESVSAVSGFNYTQNGQHGLYWTGLVDGIPGETFREGTNIYPLGLFMAAVTSGNINSNAVVDRLCWIDPYRWELTGIVGGADVPNADFTSVFPGRANNTFIEGTEPEIGGDAFDWQPIVFYADPDATLARPKGLLQVTSIEELATGGVLRYYVRLFEFNPFDVAPASGQATRVHGRIRLTSRALVNYQPPFGVAGQDNINNPQANYSIIYDGVRNRFVTILTNSLDPDPYPTDTNNQTVGIFAPQAEVSVVTNPAARDVPRTNDIARFEAGAFGDLGEPIAGVTVDWTLTRRSTEGEVLDASTFPGSSQLDNFPVDEDSGGNAILTIVSDGVELVETTDYTVNTATGVVTWVTDQSGASLVTATYEHRTAGDTPAHGTLLTASSQTDTDGLAETQVFYEDDDSLVGKLDHLDAQEA